MADLKTIYTKSPGNYSSSQWRTAISDTTGTGNLVFADSPALTGTPTASEPSDASNTTDIATTNFVALKAAGITSTESFDYVGLSGTSQTLNLNNGNFFDGGVLTGDTTVAFSNIPAGDSKWTYTFDTGWNLLDSSNVVYSGINIGLNDVSNNHDAMRFSDDGTRLYISGNGSSSQVLQYGIGIPWDLSSGVTYQGSLTTPDSAPRGIFFKPDGTKVFIVGSNNDNIYEYSLTVPWDITAGSTLNATESILPNDFVGELFFKSDGKAFFTCESGSGFIYVYTVGTPWDITTMSFIGGYDIPGGWSIFYRPNGKTLFRLDEVGVITQFNFTNVPWVGSISATAQYTFTEVGSPSTRSISFSLDGSRMYILNDSTGTGGDVFLYQYELLPFTLSLPESVRNFDYASVKPGRNTLEFYTTDGGTNIYVNHTVF